MRRFAIWMLLLALGGYCADRDLAGRYTGEWKSRTGRDVEMRSGLYA